MNNKIFTIGFTKKTAANFFGALSRPEVHRVVDVRLNNISQLAGFAKKKDLEYFLKTICGLDYVHIPELAPTKQILDTYKKNRGSWDVYQSEFIELMYKRNIEKTLSKEVIYNGCLLCSENKPHHCHRRLVAEYLKTKWDENIEIIHL
jgi:uncharacterized protein (DUF488 family)